MKSIPMTMNEFIALIKAMTPKQQSVFLARITFEITLCARGMYSDQEQLTNSNNGLGAINEFQHQISQMLMRALEWKEKINSERLQGFVDMAREAQCLVALHDAALYAKREFNL